jgi:hypothetical protein
MKGKHIVIGHVALIFSISLLICGGGGCPRPVRATEPVAKMTDLNNLDQLKQAFERDRGNVRIVSLLSPV